MVWERYKLEAKYIREAQLGFGKGEALLGFFFLKLGFKFSYYSVVLNL